MASIQNKDYIPIILWGCLVAGIIVLAFTRESRAVDIWSGCHINLDSVFIGSYLLWMLIELKISINDTGTERKKTSDFATCQIYGTAQALTFLTALWFPYIWQQANMAHLFGLCMFLLGGFYRRWAIRTLGRFYSHKVRTVDRHRIVASGPYRYTRHPAYAGMITAHAGICIYFFNWVTISVFLLMFIPAVLIRIVVEEKVLFEIDGYAEFAKHRKRLFPAFW